jgi:hypothetical protein
MASVAHARAPNRGQGSELRGKLLRNSRAMPYNQREPDFQDSVVLNGAMVSR